jgi:hypothetical protein
MDVDTQLQPVLHHLTQQEGMSQQAAAAFLRSNPTLMYSSDFHQQAQQLLRRQKLQQLALV